MTTFPIVSEQIVSGLLMLVAGIVFVSLAVWTRKIKIIVLRTPHVEFQAFAWAFFILGSILIGNVIGKLLGWW